MAGTNSTIPEHDGTLKSLLDTHRINFREHSENKNVRQGFIGIDCPYCSPNSETFYLGINKQYLYASCWRCGPKSIVDIFSLLFNIKKKESYHIAKGVGLSWDFSQVEKKISGKYHPPKHLEFPLPKIHREYLRSRGFDPDEIMATWGVQGIRLGRWAWRLFIPAMLRGNAVSWTTRAVGTDCPVRYLSSPPDREALPIRSLIYGGDYVRNTVIVTEGPLDAWKIGPGAVATMGLGHTAQQISKIVRCPVRYICFDNESKAQERAEKLLGDLAFFEGETYNIELDANDAASARKKEIQILRRLLK